MAAQKAPAVSETLTPNSGSDRFASAGPGHMPARGGSGWSCLSAGPGHVWVAGPTCERPPSAEERGAAQQARVDVGARGQRELGRQHGRRQPPRHLIAAHAKRCTHTVSA
jgi:hypothetical protein